MQERRSRFGRALLTLVLLAVALVALAPGFTAPAAAHPLGNFTINRWARLEPTAGLVRITYVLDIAEIPTFQDRGAISADPVGFARTRAADISRTLDVRVDGSGNLPLEVKDVRLDQPKGAGGLRTTRIGVIYEASVPEAERGSSHQLSVLDRSEPDRLGWREIILGPTEGTSFGAATVTSKDPSDQLRRYPKDRLSSPPDVRRATTTYTVGTTPAAARPLEGPGAAGSSDRLGKLLTAADPGAFAIIGLLAVAFLIGCGHALAPGHGKTIMAAYLVGTRGRPLDAVFLGLIVSAMHTTSVLVLGVLLYRLDQSFAIDRIYPVLTLLSGFVVVLFGAWLATTRLRRLRREAGEPDRDHDHDHDHDHGHDHGHGSHNHGPGGHTHELPEGVAPLSRRGLVLLASSGGVVPSPSAVIVLVSALTLGRLGLGLSLIVAFSFGLAATLSAVGLALVYGRRVADARLSVRAIRLFPVLGATAILVLGTLLVINGVQAL